MTEAGGDLAGRVRERIRDVPDFPRPGVVFKDITPLLSDGPLFGDVVREMAVAARRLVQGETIDLVVGIESRGFIFGAPLALELGSGFIPLRKPGKLPFRTERVEFALEYGTDALEAHVDAIVPGRSVLLVDDVLATGGTAAAAAALVARLGGSLAGAVFLLELGFLNGRAGLGSLPVEALIRF